MIIDSPVTVSTEELVAMEVESPATVSSEILVAMEVENPAMNPATVTSERLVAAQVDNPAIPRSEKLVAMEVDSLATVSREVSADRVTTERATATILMIKRGDIFRGMNRAAMVSLSNKNHSLDSTTVKAKNRSGPRDSTMTNPSGLEGQSRTQGQKEREDVPSKRFVDLMIIPLDHPPTLTLSPMDMVQLQKDKTTGLSHLRLIRVQKVSPLLTAGEKPSFDLGQKDYFT